MGIKPIVIDESMAYIIMGALAAANECCSVDVTLGKCDQEAEYRLVHTLYMTYPEIVCDPMYSHVLSVKEVKEQNVKSEY